MIAVRKMASYVLKFRVSTPGSDRELPLRHLQTAYRAHPASYPAGAVVIVHGLRRLERGSDTKAQPSVKMKVCLHVS
jgi:hypothetical protein